MSDNYNYKVEELKETIPSNLPHIKFKIIVIGDTSVGKTEIIKQYTTKEFSENEKPTVGVDFYKKTFKINEDYIKVKIWDTAGQERYKFITNAYIKGSQGILVVYDITNEVSFNNIENWIERACDKYDQNIKIILVGNKSDLENERKVKTETALEKAEKLKIPLMEVSALKDLNIKEVFEKLLLSMYEDKKTKVMEAEEDNNLNSSEEEIEMAENEKREKSDYLCYPFI